MGILRLSLLLVCFSAAPSLAGVGLSRLDFSLRNYVERILVNIQGKYLLQTEVDAATAAAMSRMQFVFSMGEVRPAMQVKAILLEQEIRLALLRENSSLLTKFLSSFLEITNGKLRITVDGEPLLEISDSKYGQKRDVQKLIGMAKTLTIGAPKFSVKGNDGLDVVRVCKLMLEQGLSYEPLLQRLAQRKRAKRGKSLRQVFKELKNFSADERLAEPETAGFVVGMDVSSEAITSDWGIMKPIGVEALAKIYELSARIAASRRDTEDVYSNLLRILKLNSEIDSVKLSVATEDMPITILTEENIEEVSRLYLSAYF